MADDGLGETVELTVPLAELAALCDPFDGSEWGCDPIDRGAVLAAAAAGLVEREPWQEVNARRRGDRAFDDVGYHVGRIAFFVNHPEPSPLEIEVETVPGGPRHARRLRLYAGNHRFAAAILRNEAEVRVAAPAQELDDVMALLPSARDAAVPGVAHG